jgi:hypothetical protein
VVAARRSWGEDDFGVWDWEVAHEGAVEPARELAQVTGEGDGLEEEGLLVAEGGQDEAELLDCQAVIKVAVWVALSMV